MLFTYLKNDYSLNTTGAQQQATLPFLRCLLGPVPNFMFIQYCPIMRIDSRSLSSKIHVVMFLFVCLFAFPLFVNLYIATLCAQPCETCEPTIAV